MELHKKRTRVKGRKGNVTMVGRGDGQGGDSEIDAAVYLTVLMFETTPRLRQKRRGLANRKGD